MRRELTAKGIKGLMIRSYYRYANGYITDAQAMRENTILANIFKTFAQAEMEEKLDAIERAIKETAKGGSYDEED